MMEGIDGEFHFEPEGGIGDGDGSSSSTRFVNNETLVIDVDPLNSDPPFKVVENIKDSDDASLEKDVADGAQKVHKSSKATDKRNNLGKETRHKLQKVPPKSSKVAGDASDPLDVDSDHDIHVAAYLTPPSWKQHLKDISLEKLCDIHGRAYMRQAVLDNMLNNKTRKLISALTKARSSCDVIQERERENEKAYAKIEKNCNDALQDLDKNPLVVDMHAEIKTLQGQVNKLHEIDGLRQDRAAVIFKVVTRVVKELVHSDEMGLLVARLFKVAVFRGSYTAFEEVDALKEPFDFEKIPGYHSSSKKEFDQVDDDLATASYPFIAEATADLYASVEELLSKKPKYLHTKPAPSHYKPSSLKVSIN
nr:hypothetical protein [Tanacetum cinerariifolium]